MQTGFLNVVFSMSFHDEVLKAGWYFFNEVPALNTIIGMLLIVFGGIYIFIREKAQDQSIVTEKPLR